MSQEQPGLLQLRRSGMLEDGRRRMPKLEGQKKIPMANSPKNIISRPPRCVAAWTHGFPGRFDWLLSHSDFVILSSFVIRPSSFSRCFPAAHRYLMPPKRGAAVFSKSVVLFSLKRRIEG